MGDKERAIQIQKDPKRIEMIVKEIKNFIKEK